MWSFFVFIHKFITRKFLREKFAALQKFATKADGYVLPPVQHTPSQFIVFILILKHQTTILYTIKNVAQKVFYYKKKMVLKVSSNTRI